MRCGDLYASKHGREQCYNELSGWESGEREKECKISVEWRACGLVNLLSEVSSAWGLNRGLGRWFRVGE